MILLVHWVQANASIYKRPASYFEIPDSFKAKTHLVSEVGQAMNNIC